MPPYFDDYSFGNITDTIKPITTNSYITCINSIPNGFDFDSALDNAIFPNNGYGGIGGKAILPIALSNVKKFSSLVNKDIVGCGGVTTGLDVKKHILCGATAVQIGTTIYENGVKDFFRISQEYNKLASEV